MAPSAVWVLSLWLSSTLLPQPIVPNRQDLKIKTRHADSISAGVETLYLKGARERQEITEDFPIRSSYVSISQCDRKLRISLNPEAKLYGEYPMVGSIRPRKGIRTVPQPLPAGANVTITYDSVDTGERRQVGAFQARHVKLDIRTDAAPGAMMHSMLEQHDGWYIDLPGLGCQDWGTQRGFAFLMPGFSTPERQDRLHFKRLGTAPLGFAIEETITRTEGASVAVSRIELLEFADSPLDPALFERPPGFSWARRNPRGGYDMTQPETLTNRLQVYWTALTGTVHSWFGRR